jgi:hypothetical protein
LKRIIAGAVATAGLVLCFGSTAMSEGGDVILAGSGGQVDYHAEAAPSRAAAPDGGASIIGGNIHIVSDRGVDEGVAGGCDPDPRPAPHTRPEDQGCTWATPAGDGEDFIAFGRHVQNDLPEETGELGQDTDTSPNGAFAPVTTDTRESFNGRGGIDRDNLPFQEDRPVLDDEDLNFRLRGRETFAYLAPQGNADNRWRRLCGLGEVEELSNNLPIAAPFEIGQLRPFVVQIWDADFKDPSDLDGGNQDYFIIDVYDEGTTFDLSTCQPKKPDVNPPNNPPVNPPNNPPAVTPPAVTPPAAAPGPPASQGVEAVVIRRRARGSARIAGARTCPVTPFSVRVQGRQIRRVTFLVDGRRVAVVRRADRVGRWLARINPRGLRSGTRRVRAQVQFISGAGPTRTLRMSFRVCARPARQVQPSFTG